MLKIIIYHEGYRLSSRESKERKIVKKHRKREENIHRSLRRTKTTIQDIMLCNRFDYWCTFTYNCRNCKPKCDNNPCVCTPGNCNRWDINYTRRIMQNWFRNQKKHSPNLKYLAVPEYHKNGAIHFHCLLSNFNGRLKDSGKKTKYGQVIYNASGYYSGFTEFVRIGERFDSRTFEEDYNRVICYITKYITKDMPLVYGRQRFLVSQELIRPVSVVNGVSRFSLRNVIKGAKPEFINNIFEVQKHSFVGGLSKDPNHSLF